MTPGSRIVGGCGILLLVVIMSPVSGQSMAAYCASITLQSLVDSTPSGGTLSLPPCIFRETVKLTKPITLDGQGVTELRGSDVWTAWTPTASSTWVSQLTVPPLPVGSDAPANPSCTPGTANRCFLGEQVFLDGSLLSELAPGTIPSSGFFSLVSASDRRIQLADDPTVRQVEVTTRERWVNSYVDGLTINGIKFEHAGTAYNRSAAISNDGHSNWTLSNSTLLYAHAQAVGVYTGSNVRVLCNDLAYNGQSGIGGDHATAPLIQCNHIHDNNSDGLFNGGWDAAGLKITNSAGIMLLDNESDHNSGQGVWIDIHDTGDEIARNRVHDNNGFGIMYEISSGGSIHDNSVWGNVQSGIFASSAASTDIARNTSAWNTLDGIRIEVNRRSDNPPVVGTNLTVRDNAVMQASTTRGAESWVDNTGTSVLYAAGSNNSGSNERYWFPMAEGAARRFYWGTSFPTLSGFAATPAGSGASYLTDADAMALLTASGIPNLFVPTPTPTLVPTLTATPTQTASPTTTVPPTPTLTATPSPTRRPAVTPTSTPVCLVYTWQGKTVLVPKDAAFCNR